MRTYNINKLQYLTKEDYLQYVKKVVINSVKEVLGIDLEESKWNQTEQHYSIKYDELMQNGLDIGFLNECIVKVKDLVIYENDLYALCDDKKLYMLDTDLKSI